MDINHDLSAHKQSDLPVTMKGAFSRIVFRNPENNYIVARFIEEGKIEPYTVVGFVPNAVEGQFVVITGKWEYNPRFGPQIHLKSCQECTPSSREGIERFLGSGLIGGIGAEMAKRIVDTFGEKTLEIIDSVPGRLKEVEGIGKKRIKMIVEGWNKHKDTRHILITLNDIGLSQSLTLRIFNKYKENSVKIIENNPYRLAYELRGIGFHKADEIALKAGKSPSSPERIEAAVYYYLHDFSEEGDVYTPYNKLTEKIAHELQLPVNVIEPVIDDMASHEKIIIQQEYDDKPIYLKTLFEYEFYAAQKLARMINGKAKYPVKIDEKSLAETASKLKIQIDDELKKNLPEIINHQIILITGGPGTGKTTIVKLILELLRKSNQGFQLCAPTGRAAKRMQETTGYEASTIHRLLEYIPAKENFLRNTTFPIDTYNLIVDEVSMVDIFIMYNLLQAIKDGTRLILVGDADQLPSVGPGAVLQNLVSLDIIPKIVLKKIYRQAHDSLIVLNAHRINNSEEPILTPNATDFFFIQKDNPEEILDLIKILVKNRIPEKFGLDPIHDIQVISPMRKGKVGVENLNSVLQDLLNHNKKQLSYGGFTYKQGDKIMQIKNNYDLEVFNGDIGFITDIDEESGILTLNFEGREISYERAWLEDVSPAYAISVHKSQGSEYPAVIIPLAQEHYMMLQKNLLYTGVTRAKKLVVLVGSRRALYRCLHNNKIKERNSLLSIRCEKTF